MSDSEILVIGSGIAGLTFALKASQKHRVTLITKRGLEESNTRYSQGGIAAVTSTDDSIESHVQDTLKAGGGLCDEKVVQSICSRAPRLIRDLHKWGVDFSLSTANENFFELGLEGGHAHRRILHAGDFTGLEIENKLTKKIRENQNIQVFENHIAVDLITQSKILGKTSSLDTCLGAYVLDIHSNQVVKFLSKVTVLATGGAGKIYIYPPSPVPLEAN